MAKGLGDLTITLSVLDRLIDTEPTNRSEAAFSRAQSVRLLKQAVRRDLEWLLNTRRVATEVDDSLKETTRSGYLYGLPDFSAYSMSASADRLKLTRQILASVGTFEPRLFNVRLVVVDSEDAAKKDVRLRVEAMLRMDPVPEPITFDTIIDLKSGNCRVLGDDLAR